MRRNTFSMQTHHKVLSKADDEEEEEEEEEGTEGQSFMFVGGVERDLFYLRWH